MGKIAFLFDGQGAFRPGIGKELYTAYSEAKKIIDAGSDILGYDLKDWLWGDKAVQTADKTSIAQPAIAVVSLAYAAVLKGKHIVSEIALGHSLGEVTAIVYCGILSLNDGLKVIKKRGELMEHGGKEGTMMAMININASKLQEICTNVAQATSEPVVIANINAPGQIVISGSKTSIKQVAQAVAREHGRGIPLKVGGAWHSPYLKDASMEFSGFLDTITFNTPVNKFYSVVDHAILNDPDRIKGSLKQQMLSQVDWVTAINNITSLGCTKFLEIGPSKILKDLVLKIDMNLSTDTTALYTDLDVLAQKL
ncbi:ACP S-malonyltransferase [candidate division WOR-3 bacterium]|nr:ACP S-malonyltransferase [candidate division WOR-3 bacterium]